MPRNHGIKMNTTLAIQEISRIHHPGLLPRKDPVVEGPQISEIRQ
jgi:hypothetical protein